MTLSASISKDHTGTKNPFFGKKHSAESRAKISEALTGRKHSPEHRANLSKALTGKKHSAESRAKISEDAKKRYEDPTNNPMFGKKHSPETRAKQSDAAKKRLEDPEERQKISDAAKKAMQDPEVRKRISATKQRVSLEDWSGFVSFEPYCEKFNFKKKEQVREQYGRRCFHCHKPESLNGKKLSVHHVDGDKMQGCNGNKWFLVPLCQSCHNSSGTVELVRERIESKIAKYRILGGV